MFNIFAALLATYVYRTAGHRRQLIGAPFHNRRCPLFRDTIGLIMEVVPLRITIEERDTFVSLLRRIGSEASTAFRLSPSVGKFVDRPAYDVLLNYTSVSFLDFHGVSVRAERVHTNHENHSLALRVRDYGREGNLVLDFEFHRDVFDPMQRARAVRQFIRILDDFLENPDRPLGAVDLLTDAERESILSRFSRSDRARPEVPYLPRAFEAQVRSTPDQPAVFFEGRTFSYAQLNSQGESAGSSLAFFRSGRPGHIGGDLYQTVPWKW
jgi:non-ribosomal peptide synthetase component F